MNIAPMSPPCYDLGCSGKDEVVRQSRAREQTRQWRVMNQSVCNSQSVVVALRLLPNRTMAIETMLLKLLNALWPCSLR